MKRIEIIGAPYVGKTTVLQELRRHHDKNSPWATEEEVYLTARKQVGYFNDFTKRFVKKVFPNSEVAKKYRYFGLSDIENIDNDYLMKFSKTLDLCFLQTSRIKDIKLALRVYHKMMFMISKLNYYKVNKKQILLVEEFILHWHLMLIKHIADTPVDHSKWTDDEGLSPAGIIFCRADEDILQKRMDKRIRSNTINKNHEHKTYEEIFSDIRNKQRSFLILTSFLKQNNVPVLSLDTGLNVKDNASKVLRFIESIEVSKSVRQRENIISTKKKDRIPPMSEHL